MASTYKERDFSGNNESLADAIGSTVGTSSPSVQNTSIKPTAGKTMTAQEYSQRAQELSGSAPQFQPNDAVTGAKNYLDQVIANKPGSYQGQYTGKVQQLYEQLMNRPKFSYNQNSDAMYQMYAQRYKAAGQQGMRNAMGAAAAQQTGGYGSSYAQTAGQQQYNASMNQLADMVPQLQQQALSRYNDETQRMSDMYNTAAQADQMEYGRYQDSVSRWQNERDYAANEYDRQYNNQYNTWRDSMNNANNFMQMEREDQQMQMQNAQQMAMQQIKAGIWPGDKLIEQAGWDIDQAKKLVRKYR